MDFRSDAKPVVCNKRLIGWMSLWRIKSSKIGNILVFEWHSVNNNLIVFLDRFFRDYTFCFQDHLQLGTVSDIDVKSTLIFSNLVSVADDFNLRLITWQNYTMFLDHFPNTILLFCKGCILGRYIGLVLDCQLLFAISEDLYLSII